MSTIFSQIIGAIVTELGSATAVSAQIHRSRVRPASSDWTTMVVVRPTEANFERFSVNGAVLNVDTTIAVECYARTISGTAPDVAVDTLLSAVYARLAANPTLSGLVSDLVAQTLTYDFDADGEPTVCATLTYTALHRAQNLTLE